MDSAAIPPTPIHVLIVDDSVVMREALSRAVDSSPSLTLCGTARDGIEALEMIRQWRPDVVTLDVEMPLLNGIECLKQIMRDFPRPVIMVSSYTQTGAETTVEALSIGAFDFLSKSDPAYAANPQKLRDDLVAKIEAAARSPLARQHEFAHAAKKRPELNSAEFRVVPEIVAIGTSTGGPGALQEILPQLPPDLPVPTVVVQHMPPGFTAPLAKRLNTISRIKVREAEHGDVLEAGTVYIARAGRHLALQGERRSKVRIVHLENPNDTPHRPSVDVMMTSVSEVFGQSCLGIILTGMGNDGLAGMTAIHEAGGITIGQDEATSTVYGMPRVCAEHGILQKSVPLPEVAWQIKLAVRYAQKTWELRKAAATEPFTLNPHLRRPV